jgi:hypothetical protein
VVRNGDTNASAISEHAWEHQHRIGWKAVEVSDSNMDWYLRRLIESWHIHMESSERGPLLQIHRTLLKGTDQ